MAKNDIRQFVADRIKETRSSKSLTQTELAKLSGLNRSYLADIEMGNRNFGIDTLDRVLSGLDINYEYFFKGR